MFARTADEETHGSLVILWLLVDNEDNKDAEIFGETRASEVVEEVVEVNKGLRN